MGSGTPPCGNMRVGDFVIWRGRTYRLLGFDPMSVEPGRAYLEDAETGAAELGSASPGSAVGPSVAADFGAGVVGGVPLPPLHEEAPQSVNSRVRR